MTAWLARNWDTYFRNPTAQRDFRTQLRGTKPVLLWSLYLAVLILIGVTIYSSLAREGETSVVYLQQSLTSFYQAIMALLSAAIMLVTPALTAGSIAGERQRRSLDLVLTTPLEPKAYLVGKLIASYRYTWLLLMLALPIASTCVVLGGATWQDVLSAFIYLSLFGLVFTALGLLMSVSAPKPTSAMVYAYVAVLAYCFLTSTLMTSAAFYFSGPPSSFRGSHMEMPFIMTLSPFGAGLTAGTYSTILGVAVPNWLLFGVLAIGLAKFLLLGAASKMSQFGSTDTKSLRIHGLVYAGVVSMLVGMWLATATVRSSFLGTPPGLSTGYGLGSWFASYAAWLIVGIHWLIPFASCYSSAAEKRFQYDGTASYRGALMGTPSGGLPYMLMLVLTVFAGGPLGAVLNGGFAGGEDEMLASLLWCGAFVSMMWAIARFASSVSNSLTSARGLAIAFYVALLLLPVVFIRAASLPGDDSIWKLYPLYVISGHFADAPFNAILMIAIAIPFALFAAWNENARQNRQGNAR